MQWQREKCDKKRNVGAHMERVFGITTWGMGGSRINGEGSFNGSLGYGRTTNQGHGFWTKERAGSILSQVPKDNSKSSKSGGGDGGGGDKKRVQSWMSKIW